MSKVAIDLSCTQDLAVINKFVSSIDGEVSVPRKNIAIPAALKFSRKSIELNYTISVSKENKALAQLGTVIKSLIFEEKDEILYLEKLSIESVSFGIPEEIKATIYAVRSKNFKRKSLRYHKVYIPVTKEFAFSHMLEEKIFSIDSGRRSRHSIEITLKDEVIRAYIITPKATDQRFLVLTSTRKQQYEEFKSKVSAIQIVFGYVVAHAPGDKGYFLQYTSYKMADPLGIKVTLLRESTQSIYHTVNSRPYRHLYGKERLANKFANQLKIISSAVLSRLVTLALEKADFAGVLLLISEATTTSLLSMPGSLAICLETLTRLIKEDNAIVEKANVSLVQSPQVKKALLKGWRRTLDDSKLLLSDSVVELLYKRIDTLLVSTNKDKLNAPFIKLNIDLNDRDIELLEARNAFLHGRFPVIRRDKLFKGDEIRRIDLDLLYCSVRYYTIANMLILKWAGFKGMVINYPKLYESTTEIKLNEQPYRELV